jgi:small GTP-binding protein
VIKPQTIIEAKIVLLGDSGVGKSSIAQRYCKDTFSENYDVTIGGAYMQQTLTISGTVVKMHIWDTGGSDRFRSLVSMYYRDAHAAIVCYDLGNELSFKGVDYWTNEMKQKNNMSNFVLALSGNKCDIQPWLITTEQEDSFI